MPNEVVIEGLNTLQMKLAFFQDPQGVAAGIKEAAQHVQGVAALYPPPKADSTYRRTDNLGDGWTVNPFKLGASVENNVDYGPYVQGEQQVGFHAVTGWKTTDQIAEKEKKVVLALIQDAVERVLNK